MFEKSTKDWRKTLTSIRSDVVFWVDTNVGTTILVGVPIVDSIFVSTAVVLWTFESPTDIPKCTESASKTHKNMIEFFFQFHTIGFVFTYSRLNRTSHL